MAASSEFKISGATHQVQSKPRAAADAQGDFVVVWQSSVDSYGILGRRFSSDGTAQGDNFEINSYTTGFQVFPDIVMKESGEFVVIWQSYYHQDGDGFGIYAQQFDANADPVGSEVAVNTTTEGDQHDASVAYGVDGGFFVIWDHDTASQHEILVQRFDASGNRVGAEQSISSPAEEDDFDPRIALRGDGSLVAVWERTLGDGSGKAVFAQLLTQDGAPDGGEFQVNEFTTFDQENAEVAVAADGSFAITWASQDLDDSGEAVAFKIYDSDGTARTTDIQANLSTANNQSNPMIMAADDGGFVIVWESQSGLEPEAQAVIGRCFDSLGQGVGGEFQVNEIATGDQYYADIAAAANGRFIVTWTSDDCSDCHRESEGRLFDLPLMFTDGFESGDTVAWSSTTP